VINALFAVCYASAGIALRPKTNPKFWTAFLVLATFQFVGNGLLNHFFPGTPQQVQLDVAETARLHGRLTFDGCAVIVCVTLGYIGFVRVSVSEARRHILAQTEKAILESEMAAAREVQRVMVPEDPPHISGYAIESAYRPAADVGGDFFQVIPLKSGRTLVVIGDVSGKGLRAAMIVSMIIGTLRTVCGYTEEPAQILDELNRRICGHMHEGFATCLAVRLEDNGKIELANAGHLPPYIDGKEVPLPGSLPLGLMESALCEQTGLQMAVGDSLVLLTDGVAEAHNEKRVLLGFDRVESMLRTGATAKSVADFAHQYGQDDDITVLRIVRQV
jgi:serine phosphatase RsbU (regulator of sigma subunit)